MNCPYCNATDLRDIGHVRGFHVFLCRKCGGYSNLQEALVRLTDKATLTSVLATVDIET